MPLEYRIIIFICVLVIAAIAGAVVLAVRSAAALSAILPSDAG